MSTKLTEKRVREIAREEILKDKMEEIKLDSIIDAKATKIAKRLRVNSS